MSRAGYVVFGRRINSNVQTEQRGARDVVIVEQLAVFGQQRIIEQLTVFEQRRIVQQLAVLVEQLEPFEPNGQ